jgi:TolA-binding protein
LNLIEAVPPLPDDSPPAPPRIPTSTAGIAEPNLQVVRDKVAEGLFQPALTDLGAILEEYPDSRLVPDALLLRADVYRQANRLELAHATLVEIGSRFSESPHAAEALFRRGELMVASKKKASKLEARELFARVVEDYPLSLRAPDALVAKAAIEQEEKIKLRDPGQNVILPAALATYRQIVERYAYHPAAEEALWRLGQIHASMKHFDLAVQSFDELGRRFPSTRFDVWWEVGRLHDRKLDDAARARDSYRRVPQGSPNFSAAQKRLRKLRG